MSDLERKFYQEILQAINIFVSGLTAKIKDKSADMASTSFEKDYEILQNANLNEEQFKALKKVVKEACIGTVHSLLVSIDGGTALSDHGKALEIINRETNKPLTEGALHENFYEVVGSEANP